MYGYELQIQRQRATRLLDEAQNYRLSLLVRGLPPINLRQLLGNGLIRLGTIIHGTPAYPAFTAAKL